MGKTVERKLLNEAMKIGQSGEEHLKDWFASLTVEEQTELAEQFYVVLNEELLPTIQIIMERIKTFTNYMIESWSKLAKQLNVEK